MKAELALQPKSTALLDPTNWNMIKEQASILVRSGMLPSSVTKPEAAVAIMMKGVELNIPPMQAFSHIHIIKGKPTISAELMLALIYRMFPNAEIDFQTYENDICEILAARPGRQQKKFAFTIEDAKLAQLTSKDTWRMYPRAMCRSRAIAEMARTVFPDALMGCSYTPEELDDSGRLDHEGNTIEVVKVVEDKPVEPKIVTPPPPPPPPQPLPEPEIFDQENEKHCIRLETMLKHLDVQEADWGAVAEMMHGREMLPRTAKDVCKALGFIDDEAAHD